MKNPKMREFWNGYRACADMIYDCGKQTAQAGPVGNVSMSYYKGWKYRLTL